MKLNAILLSGAAALALMPLPSAAQDPPGTAPAAPAVPAPAPDPLAWFAGTWDISYEDASLGTVRGQAVVRTDDGPPLIKYVVIDPRDGTQHDLMAFKVEVSDTEVTMELPPGGPSAVDVNEGGAASAVVSTEVFRAPLNAKVRAKLGNSDASVLVTAVASRAYTRLRLERKGTELTGEWITAQNSFSGYQGARSGTRGVETQSRPSVLGDEEVEVMRGAERWEPTRMLVERAHRVSWQHHRTTREHHIANVQIDGRNLPDGGTGKMALIQFADPLLKALNMEITYGPGGNSLMLPVQVGAGAVPGPKSFVLRVEGGSNQAPGVWVFDWPGLELKSIHATRKISDDLMEPSRLLVQGEHFYVEVHTKEDATERPSFGDTRGFTIEAPGAPWCSFHVVRDPAKPHIFRAGPFLLLEPEDRTTATAASGVVEPEMQSNLTERHAPGDGQSWVVRARAGETLRMAPAAAGPDDWRGIGMAEVIAASGPQGPFERALAKARQLRARFPSDDRYNISRFTVSGGSRRTSITVHDHAALILLHEELSTLMGKTMRDYSRAWPLEDLRKLQDELVRRAGGRTDDPLFDIEVPAPDGTGVLPLGKALSPEGLGHFEGDAKARTDYLDRVVNHALAEMTGHIGMTTMRIGEVDISQPAELLPVLKPAYEVAASGVMPRLVRRSRPGSGEPAVPAWVPDIVGRAAVRGIADLLGAIEADESLQKTERLMATLMAVPFVLIAAPAAVLAPASAFAPGGAVAVGAEVILGAASAQNAMDWDKATLDARYARGLMPVTGRDPYDRANSEAAWAAAGMIADVAVPVTLLAGPKVLRAFRAMRKTPSPEAVESAVSQALRYGTESLPAAEKANLAWALGRAEQKAIAEGPQALTELERKALQAAYPHGLPPHVAAKLRIKADDPRFAVQSADDAATVPPGYVSTSPAAPEAVAGGWKDGPPTRWNATLARKRDAAVQRLRGGDESAREELKRLYFYERLADNLSREERARVLQAQAIWERLGKTNPAVKAVDEAEAAKYFMLHSRRPGSAAGSAVTADGLVAEAAAMHSAPVRADDLARAANVSPARAEASVFAAEQRVNAMPDASSATLPGPAVDPKSSTIGLPSPPPGPSPRTARALENMDDAVRTDPERMKIADLLEHIGMPRHAAESASMVPAARAPNARVGAAAAAMERGIPPGRVSERLGISRDQLRSELDDHYRSWSNATDAERKQWLDNYFDSDPTLINGVRRTPSSPSSGTVRVPRPNQPPGVRGRPQSPEQMQAQVDDSLKAMGVSPDVIAKLETEKLVRNSGAGADEIAAGLSRRLDVDSRTAARALNADETQFAGMLDRYEAMARPELSPTRRAAEVAKRLEADDVTEPYARVLRARQDQVNAGLRDVGIMHGDPNLAAKGLDSETLITGQALERGVAADDLVTRRGLTRSQLESNLNDYLRDARGITDASERAAYRTQYLSGAIATADGSTVRIPAPVVAARDDIASGLRRMGVDPLLAAARAEQVANLGRSDAHAALVVGAWRSQVPPATVRAQFGLTDGQVARSLDRYLENYMGMRDPGYRAQYIGEQYFGRHGQPFSAAQVRGMIAQAPPVTQPLRPVSAAASPPSAPVPPPPPRPAPLSAPPESPLDARFGPAKPPTGPRPGETLSNGEYRTNPGTIEATAGKPWIVHPSRRYNWLVDENGRLMVAPESFAIDGGRAVLDPFGNPARLGHPTLINGRPARIAGELQYFEGRGWVINNLSGRYSFTNKSLNSGHLDNAAQVFEQSGLPVKADFQQ